MSFPLLSLDLPYPSTEPWPGIYVNSGINSMAGDKNHPCDFGMDLRPQGWISIPFYKNHPNFNIIQLDHHCKLKVKLATGENFNVLIYCKYNK